MKLVECVPNFSEGRDAEGKFMGRYLDSGILPHDPFSTVDFEGVGELMKMAVEIFSYPLPAGNIQGD